MNNKKIVSLDYNIEIIFKKKSIFYFKFDIPNEKNSNNYNKINSLS